MDPATAAASAGVADSARPVAPADPAESGSANPAGPGSANPAGPGAANPAGPGAANPAGPGSRPVSVRPTGSKLAAGPSGPGASTVKCRVREILGRVGDKWSLFVIFRLGDGPQRFTALQRSVEGVSQRMLTVTLRGLERDGIVSRTMYPVMPPRVDYALTPLGHTLLDAVGALMAWADEHLAEIDAARVAYDAPAARDAYGATAGPLSPQPHQSHKQQRQE